MTIALLIGVPVSTAVAFAFVRDDVDTPGEAFNLRTLAASAGLGVTSGRRARLALLFALVGALLLALTVAIEDEWKGSLAAGLVRAR
jgi:hypothetical protein